MANLFNKILYSIACVSWLAINPGLAATKVYSGEARRGDKVVYTETHTVAYDDAGKVVAASTEYRNAAGDLVGTLKSDFNANLTAPNHDFEDLRSGNKHGIRNQEGKLVLYNQDKGKAEKSRDFKLDRFRGKMVVGCQGLHYYLLDNLDEVGPGKKIPLAFLIPGGLEYYDFDLRRKSESPDGIIEFEIKIHNWFLKLFAPKLIIKYDKNKKQLVYYQGLSNIADEKGKIQNVTIEYKY